MQIQPINPELSAAQALIAELDAYMADLYPPESNHLDDIQTLKQANVLFLGIYIENQLVGCGAVKIITQTNTSTDKYGEIKRIFIKPEYRGRGLSKPLINQLETYLKANSVPIARLEMGIYQPEALGLYRQLGYIEREPFGDYKPDPLSTFMEKILTD